MRAILTRRALLLPLWAGVGACSLVVDTSTIDAEGCGSLQRKCDDGVCRYLSDSGYGCGKCKVCELDTVPSEPTGYATIACIAETSSTGSNMPPEASMGSSSTYKCDLAHPTCMDGFHGDRCQYPDNDFKEFLVSAGGCPADTILLRGVRPGVDVCWGVEL